MRSGQSAGLGEESIQVGPREESAQWSDFQEPLQQLENVPVQAFRKIQKAASCPAETRRSVAWTNLEATIPGVDANM